MIEAGLDRRRNPTPREILAQVDPMVLAQLDERRRRFESFQIRQALAGLIYENLDDFFVYFDRLHFALADQNDALNLEEGAYTEAITIGSIKALERRPTWSTFLPKYLNRREVLRSQNIRENRPETGFFRAVLEGRFSDADHQVEVFNLPKGEVEKLLESVVLQQLGVWTHSPRPMRAARVRDHFHIPHEKFSTYIIGSLEVNIRVPKIFYGIVTDLKLDRSIVVKAINNEVQKSLRNNNDRIGRIEAVASILRVHPLHPAEQGQVAQIIIDYYFQHVDMPNKVEQSIADLEVLSKGISFIRPFFILEARKRLEGKSNLSIGTKARLSAVK